MELKQRKINENKEEKTSETINLRYGPMPTFPNQRRFARHIIVVAVVIIVYFYSQKEKEQIFASSTSTFPQRTMPVQCSKVFTEELSQYSDCLPGKCGRGIYDSIVTGNEIETLLTLANEGFALSKPAGGVAILDLHSGALSHGDKFINLYKAANVSNFLSQEQFSVYRTVKLKIQHAIASQFMINPSKLHLTHPTFFSRLTSLPAQTIHDEYWHPHVDKETYETFHYTALLYLSGIGTDFKGGRFHFIEKDNSSWVVEPVKGRVLIFTSGDENTHRVERVESGIRTALTIAFTCDASRTIKDPTLPTT